MVQPRSSTPASAIRSSTTSTAWSAFCCSRRFLRGAEGRFLPPEADFFVVREAVPLLRGAEADEAERGGLRRG